MVPIRSKYHTECNVYVFRRAGESSIIPWSTEAGCFSEQEQEEGLWCPSFPLQSVDSHQRGQAANTYGGLGHWELCACVKWSTPRNKTGMISYCFKDCFELVCACVQSMPEWQPQTLNRIIEWLGLKGASKTILSSCLSMKGGQCPTEEVVQPQDELMTGKLNQSQ